MVGQFARSFSVRDRIGALRWRCVRMAGQPPRQCSQDSRRVRLKRAGAFEVTIRRGAIHSELQQLLSKLSLHRASVHGSYVVIIKGRKKYRLGRLDQLDFRKLLSTIQDCPQEYGTCGLEITEQTAGAGALYKSRAHGVHFKNAARRQRGIFAQ